MGFLDKIKNLFRKNENVSVDDVKKVTGEVTGEKEETLIEEKKSEFDQSVEKSELFDVLNSVNIDITYLALDRIENEADTVANYVKGLIKDLGTYNDFKDDKQKMEVAVRGIGGKIKQIAIHGLELKNLLANLEDHYYEPAIETLKKVNEKVNKEEIAKLIENTENDLKLAQELDSQITKVVGYDGLFNPDKNSKYKEEIDKEAIKRIVHGDLQALLDKLLNLIVNRSLGIKSKIEKENPLEKAKKFL